MTSQISEQTQLSEPQSKHSSSLVKAAVVGASGYAGEQLVALLSRHPQVELHKLLVSEQSSALGKKFSDLYPKWKGLCDLKLDVASLNLLQRLSESVDWVFLATDHSVSMHLVPKLVEQGLNVVDLSGAYRLSRLDAYPKYYHFEHKETEWLKKAVYGLPEWYSQEIRHAAFIAVPGCYPTSALLALKPLVEAGLLTKDFSPIVHSVSGVSGAGKKPNEKTHFCEVSLQPYGCFSHRHQPEIDQYLGIDTIFQPNLGSFKRGILTTVYAQLKHATREQDVENCYRRAYTHSPCVRLTSELPAISYVENTPFCDIAFRIQGRQLIIFSALDNLLKGASSQAVQCMNVSMGFEEMESLL